MQGIRCSPPPLAWVAVNYVLGEKVDPMNMRGLSPLFNEARLREDLGANAIWSPSHGGPYPSSIYA